MWFTYASCEFEFISHCLQKRAASHILSLLSRDPRTIPFTFKLFICSRRSSKVKRAINLRPPCSTALAALQYKNEYGCEVLRIFWWTKSITNLASSREAIFKQQLYSNIYILSIGVLAFFANIYCGTFWLDHWCNEKMSMSDQNSQILDLSKRCFVLGKKAYIFTKIIG